MIYKTIDGKQVAHQGSVVIEGTYHYVENGFVYCNKALNHKSWDTTHPQNVCPVCKKKLKLEFKQLKLF